MASIANTDGHGWGLIIMLTHKVKLPGDYIVEFTWTGKNISEEFFKCSSRSDFLMAYYDERRKFTSYRQILVTAGAGQAAAVVG
jgi:hypothetical protein